ncbi:hypothetical protein ACFQX8_14115 [Klenkia terrae]|uniref:hypothetical protein n=1 Tax=Klenkia terrae TaxID=1052259 RepID=UPI00360CEA8B
MTDLPGLRASYDRVADAYVEMAAGDLGPHPGCGPRWPPSPRTCATWGRCWTSGAVPAW